MAYYSTNSIKIYLSIPNLNNFSNGSGYCRHLMEENTLFQFNGMNTPRKHSLAFVFEVVLSRFQKNVGSC